MFVYFDIGFTLLGGPSTGPARRLVEMLGLPSTAKGRVAEVLFTQPFVDAEHLADHLCELFHTSTSMTRESVQQLWRAQIEEARLLPGAAELLSALRQAQIPFGFISDIWSPFHSGFTHLLPKESLHCPGFYSFQQRCAKPDPELYRRALHHTKMAAEEVIMVGDTYSLDMAPARKMGMKTVWVLHRPEQEKRELLGVLNGLLPTPEWTVGSLAEITVERLRAVLAQGGKG
ncbi:HAD family hydrolase [Candidatus Magnetaquicoccus inordinatus]|uniref:HAD family hydrolase n=1 Tax=Candidatus Magnetaquicoccus inordinatus TaxID=2496818 RepID=UPI00102CAA80|nr:HAD-IA family hydrolase [Candidatus Magnetaquicoccus inordinatus]